MHRNIYAKIQLAEERANNFVDIPSHISLFVHFKYEF